MLEVLAIADAIGFAFGWRQSTGAESGLGHGSAAPILVGLARHGGRGQVLDLESVSDAARTVAEAVVLDLVQPVRPGRRLLGTVR